MEKTFKNTEELPISLKGDDVAAVLNISRAGAYKLMNSEGFPSLRIGKRIVVPKDAFIRWVDANTGNKLVKEA